MDLDKLFETISSDILTEEIKLTISTIFESAVTEAVKAKEVELEETNKTEIQEFREELTTQIDEYLNYIVEEFIKENEGAVDSRVKVKTAEKILETFSKIVNDFNVELSEEKVEQDDSIDALKEEVSKLGNQVIEA